MKNPFASACERRRMAARRQSLAGGLDADHLDRTIVIKRMKEADRV